MRTFLAGFKDEHICKDVSMDDLEDEEEDGVIESAETEPETVNPVMS